MKTGKQQYKVLLYQCIESMLHLESKKMSDQRK